MSKLKDPLKVWQLFLIGFALMLFGTYIIAPMVGLAGGGIFTWAGLIIWVVATVKGIKKLLKKGDGKDDEPQQERS